MTVWSLNLYLVLWKIFWKAKYYYCSRCDCLKYNFMQPYSPLQFIKLISSDTLFDNLPKTLSFWPDRQTYCKVRFHLCKVMIVPCSLKTILGSTISLCSWDNLFCKFGLQILGDLFDNFPSECQGLSPPDQIGKLIVSQVSVSVVSFSHQLLPSFGLDFCVSKT